MHRSVMHLLTTQIGPNSRPVITGDNLLPSDIQNLGLVAE